MRANARLESEHAVSEFHWVEGTRDPGPSAVVRPMGAEQSNSSLVFDEALALKLYRRVEAGINPELELLRFLTDRGFESVPALAGWYEYTGRLMEATLGVMQEFLPGARDGWELALDELGTEPEAFLERVRALGEVDGSAAHRARARTRPTPRSRPRSRARSRSACSRRPSTRRSSASSSTCPRTSRSSRSPGAARRCASSCACSTHVGSAGKVIRTHGDYHLGQTMLAAARLGGARLRGRAGAGAAGAAAQALAAARRGGHDALVRVRRLRLGDPARRGAARGLGGPGARGLPRRLPRGRRPVAAAGEPPRRGAAAVASSSSRRRSTSCATS